MRLTTEDLKIRIEEDRRMLRDMPLLLRELSGMARGNWIVAAERQRGKSYALAQLVYQRTRQRADRRMYGTGHDFARGLHLRTQLVRGVRELVEREAGDLRHHVVQRRFKRGRGVGDADLVEGWQELLEILTARGAEVIVTMSCHAARTLEETPALRETFGIRELADLSLYEFVRVSKLNYDDALDRLMRWGRYPGVLLAPDRRAERQQRLFRTLLYEELIPRYNIRNESAVRSLLHLLAEHLGEELSYNGLCRMLQAEEVKVGVTTVAEYISMLKEAQLLYSVVSLSERTSRLPKQRYWFCDNGLLSLFASETRLCERLLRNTMALSVIKTYRDHAIYCVSLRNASVDFYLPERDCAIGLCSNDETVYNAVRDLQRFDRKYPTAHKYIYTVGRIASPLPSGIFCRSLPEWSAGL